MNPFRTAALMAGAVVLSATTTLANPALMQKNKPGYPYPGTQATENFGASALLQATVNDNREQGIDVNQIHGEEFHGMSDLPPANDPERISPFSRVPAAANQKTNALVRQRD